MAFSGRNARGSEWLSKASSSGSTSGHTLVTFNLTEWITYVLDGNLPSNVTFCPNNPEEVYNDYLIVNCYDCAAALSVMSKVVGARATIIITNLSAILIMSYLLDEESVITPFIYTLELAGARVTRK